MAAESPLIIAHRGASGYLPEHTLPAKALAYGLGADYIEQDVVVSRDDELVVLHDVHLETVCNVAEAFPARAREDGRFYVRDFDLAELKTLKVHERRQADGENAVYPGRFPTGSGSFSIASLAEEIELVQGLNRSTGRNVGIYPEVKAPEFHHQEGVDASQLLLTMLADYGYRNRDDAVFVQCFHAAEVIRMRKELGTDLRLVQLLGENSWGESSTDYDVLKTPQGLESIAAVADGLGPWIGQLYSVADIDGQPVSSGLVKSAHAAGLKVHPYTFRRDQLAPGFDDFPQMVQWFVETLQVDGLFTDFPDIANQACRF